MCVWMGNVYTPDWSIDFFGPLPYDEKQNAYIVEDVEYCIEQACKWESGIGEYNENLVEEERYVEVAEIIV